MNFKTRFLLPLILLGSVSQGQVPAIGSSKTVDVASWNLLWFAHEENGPEDLAKQYQQVGEVIQKARVDIWAFQEITDTAVFSNLLEQFGEFGHVYSTYWQDQKMALVWDARHWVVLSDSQLFKGFEADFAAGRLPLMVTLFHPDTKDTFLVIGVHLKAHTGNAAQKTEAHVNRKKSANHLFEWQKNHMQQKLIILGDWNDDIDEPLVSDSITPFVQMKTAGTFLMEAQSLLGAASWIYGNSMIDHIWVNGLAGETYKNGTAALYRLDDYIVNYPQEVSDHRPVYSSFYFRMPDPVEKKPEIEITAFPNPSKGVLWLEGLPENAELRCLDLQGKEIRPFMENDGESRLLSGLPVGIYLLIIRSDVYQGVLRLVVME